MKKYKIAVIGLWNASNLGDTLICSSVEYLIKEVFADKKTPYEIVPVHLYPDELNIKATAAKEKRVKALIHKFAGKCDFGKHLAVEYIARRHNILPRYEQYYSKVLKGMDYVIFAGGGLIKFKQQEKLSMAISAGVKIAEQYNIPVSFQACGVEGYNLKYKGCQRLDAAVNSKVVHYATTRDDIDTLETKYKKRHDLNTLYAADSAVWAAEMLGLEKAKDSKVIGLGIARGDIFEEYGVHFGPEQMIKLYGHIINSLQRRGYQWKMFCNGFGPDYKFAKRLFSELGISEEEHLLPNPENHDQLVEQVSQFGGVIALRLHACIISYSLDIPVIGLCWNQKLKHFGYKIGYPDRFVEAKDFDAEMLVKNLISSMEEGYDEEKREAYRKTAFASIEKMFAGIE